MSKYTEIECRLHVQEFTADAETWAVNALNSLRKGHSRDAEIFFKYADSAVENLRLWEKRLQKVEK